MLKKWLKAFNLNRKTTVSFVQHFCLTSVNNVFIETHTSRVNMLFILRAKYLYVENYARALPADNLAIMQNLFINCRPL